MPVPASESPSESEASARVDTADCFEIEDIDDAGWEFITRPAEPLPNGEISLLRTVFTSEESTAQCLSIFIPLVITLIPRVSLGRRES